MKEYLTNLRKRADAAGIRVANSTLIIREAEAALKKAQQGGCPVKVSQAEDDLRNRQQRQEGLIDEFDRRKRILIQANRRDLIA